MPKFEIILVENYENDIKRMERELKIFQQVIHLFIFELLEYDLKNYFVIKEPGTSDTRELQSEIARLEGRNDTLTNELKEMETKYYSEKSDKDKVKRFIPNNL